MSCFSSSNLPWFMDLTFQVPVNHCSLQQYYKYVLPIQENESTVLCLWKPFNKGNGYCISRPISNYPDTLKLTEGSISELKRSDITTAHDLFLHTFVFANLFTYLLCQVPLHPHHEFASRCKYAFTHFRSVQLLSCVLLFATPWTAACQASLSITTSGLYSNWFPLSQWCHATISSSVVPFSSCPQSDPASWSFQMSQLFESGG